METMAHRKLEEKVETCEDVQKQERPVHPRFLVYMGSFLLTQSQGLGHLRI